MGFGRGGTGGRGGGQEGWAFLRAQLARGAGVRGGGRGGER
ncbi:hypothetical protein SFR_2858 [Streptomyces sp. FR-008]|nr:hypothetical protein SFR_2858 [Streptomyces sp. FR-008]